MAGSQRSSSTPKSYSEFEEEKQEKSRFAPPVTQDKINVSVQSMVEARLVYTGRVSGQRYEWLRAGAIISVAAEDVSDLLSKRLGGKSCCGQGGNQVFQLVNIGG